MSRVMAHTSSLRLESGGPVMVNTQQSWRRRVREVVGRGVLVSVVLTSWVLVVPASVLASPLDDASPTSEGLPGGPQVVRFLGWAMWLGLAACGGAILYGAASWKGWGSASSGRAVEGKVYVIAGLIGAFLIGLAPVAVRLMFNSGQS